jgi:hypothetical protein
MRWLLPVGVLALAAIGVIWFLSAYERVPSREWVGPSGEARSNPYLAAERFAARMGLRTRQLRALPELDALGADGVLLLPNRRQALDPRRLRNIASWVEGGGHLIAEAELVGVADPLFDLLGVQRSSGNPPPPTPALAELPDGRKLKVSIFGQAVLQAADKDAWLRVGAANAASLVSFAHGKGTVTAASGLQFARNNLVATNDNAEFFWYLMELTPAAQLHVYVRPERLSLWGFLKENAAPVLAATAALLALWLWRTGPRFGPVMPDAPPARRRLLDHLRASGRYYWAKGLRNRLIVAARDAALRRVARAQPDFAVAPAEERVARLSNLISVTKEDAERFISAGGTVRGADFIRIMHTAQRIHSALEKGNR